AARVAVDEGPLYPVVVLDRAVRLAHDVEDPLPVSVAELAPDLPRSLAERDGVDSLHLDEEHPDQVHAISVRHRRTRSEDNPVEIDVETEEETLGANPTDNPTTIPNSCISSLL